ncbi:MAG: Zn-dependent hydrolase [Desulfovibrio sp.]|jgi:N-carbamoyl-L-amino-acid hydrolase|nr:Zn-dependent hydrolase [Desulfovibrio sp.]
MHTVSKERLEDKIAAFMKFGAAGQGGITRPVFSPAELEARAEFQRRCTELGLTVERDDLGNIYATKSGAEKLPRIAMGSHLDSVACGGNYDGTLGVLTALEVVDTLVKDNIATRHPVTVMVCTNEEGARFPPAMMSSGVLTGKFSKDAMLAVRDDSGVTFGEALRASGFLGEEKNRINPVDYLAYLELHIEQGPVLQDAGVSIGVVQGVVGMCNYTVTTRGQANHAGTTPMKKRRDALHAAALIICGLYEKLGRIDDNLVFTFGHIDCRPNIHTIIPEEVNFSLDARHQDPILVRRVVDALESLPAETAGCQVSCKEAWSRKTTTFDPELVAIVKKNADALGYSNRFIYSGPGHDAQYMQDLLPTTMIFVPSVNGMSHCEEEKTELDDCWKGANVLLNTVLDIDGRLA